LVSQNVQADGAVGIDIRVVDASGEVDLGRLEGVVCGKVDGKEKHAALEWRVSLVRVLVICCGAASVR